MIGIIPAAGEGTRFKELGKQYSKTILPYKEKPILIHQIEWLEKHGCTDIRVVINHQEDTIKDIVKLYNKTITIVKQVTRNGLSGAILTALDESDKDNVIVILGDLVVNSNINKASFNDNFISVQKVNDYSRWCMVEKYGCQLTFHDKPKVRPNTNEAVSGVYHFLDSQNLYKLLHKQLADDSYKISNEFQISTILGWIAYDEIMLTLNIELIDFGTLDEYLQNRSVKNSRSFNDIDIKGPFITKSSELEREKLIKEVNWFDNLPAEIKVFTPRIFKRSFFNNKTSYQMEKILAPSLREIYLFLDSSEETWDGIFDAMFLTLERMETYGSKNTFMKSVLDKTKARVRNIEIPIENKIVNEFIDKLDNTIGIFNRPSLMHGDFCFSNLLYDFQGNNIKMIDPRGELFGDHYYEVAKIYHSILFDYDFIDSELYIKENDTYRIYNNGK